MSNKKETNWTNKDRALAAISVGTGVVGVSMLPATISMARSAKALKSGNYPEVVGSYLEGGNRFGKSALGYPFKKFLTRAEAGRDRIQAGVGTRVDKIVDKIAPKDRFSNQHYINFLDANPKKGRDFWIGVEAYGKPKGKFEEAAAQIYKGREIPKGSSPVKELDKLIEAGHAGKRLRNTKFTVPTYKGDNTESKALSFLHKNYKRTDADIKALHTAIDSQPGTMREAIKAVGRQNNPTFDKMLKVTAIEKGQDLYPVKYTKALTAGTLGLSSIGTVGAVGTHKHVKSRD